MAETRKFERAIYHVDKLMKRRLSEDLGPGIALALTSKDALLATRTYGVSNQSTQEPVSDRTLFQIGSITKHFTAAACLRLFQQEKLDVHAPITDYLEWFKVQSEFDTPITLHHVLTHTAGFVMMMDSYPSSWWQTWALRETELGFEPGSKFSYSNVGYNVLQCVIQTITGLGFDAALRQLIFEPLGMQESYGEVCADLYPRLAQGHKYSPHDDRPVPRPDKQHVVNWYEFSQGCGSVVTTATDLSIFLRMLLNEGLDAEGNEFLSSKTFALMTHPHAVMEGFFAGTTQGYGVIVEQSEDTGNQRRIIGGGENLGFEASMYGDFEAGIGVVLLVNSFDVAWRETRWIMDVLRAAASDEALPEWPHPFPASSQLGEKVAEYVGTFSGTERSFEVIHIDGSLTLLAEGANSHLSHEYGDNFSVNHPRFGHAMLTFERDEHNQVIGAFQLGDRYQRDSSEAPCISEYPAEWNTYVGNYRSFGILITNFKIFIRKGQLMMQAYSGYVDIALTPLGNGVFRSGDAESPERLIFDSIANGKALRCRASGCDFYRVD